MLTRTELDQLFHPLPELETERLLLQPLGSSHADDLFQVYSDAAVMEFGDDLPHADVEVSPRRRSSECARGP
jgi:hypothetical protein